MARTKKHEPVCAWTQEAEYDKWDTDLSQLFRMRSRAEQAEAKLEAAERERDAAHRAWEEGAFILDALDKAADGREVSDFEQSFPLVLVVRDLQADNAALRQRIEELERYAQHRPGCGVERWANSGREGACTCGLAALS